MRPAASPAGGAHIALRCLEDQVPESRPLAAKPWRPADEVAAVGGMAVFVEWLRATRRMTDAAPDAVRRWPADDHAGFLTAIAAFAGLDAGLGVRGNLLRHRGERVALVRSDPSGTRSWSRDDVVAGRDLPAAVDTALAGLTWPGLLALAADHLLIAGTRPDDCLTWHGDPSLAWPYGAWIVGATVVLAG